MTPGWINIYTIENERDYIINTNDLNIPPSTNAILIGETIQERLDDLERIKQKNIRFYERLYKEYPLQQYINKRLYWESARFMVFKGFELKRFIGVKNQ